MIARSMIAIIFFQPQISDKAIKKTFFSKSLMKTSNSLKVVTNSIKNLTKGCTCVLELHTEQLKWLQKSSKLITTIHNQILRKESLHGVA